VRCAGAVGAGQDLPCRAPPGRAARARDPTRLCGRRRCSSRRSPAAGSRRAPRRSRRDSTAADDGRSLEVPGRVLLLRAGARERRVRSERLCHRARERSGRAPSFHAPARPSATAARNLPKHSSSIEAITRNAVEPDATLPYRSGCSRDAPRSAKQSPPSASITARSRSTTPGSCAERRSRDGAIAAHNARVSPTRSATPATSTLPACPTTPVPSAVTDSWSTSPSRCTIWVILLRSGCELW